MAKLRKEVEIEVQKLNEPILQRRREREEFKQINEIKTKDSKTAKENEATKKATRIQETDIDWASYKLFI